MKSEILKKIDKNNSDYKFNSIEEQFNLPKEKIHVIAGPCAVESEKSINTIAEYLSKSDVKFLRGGAYKPRTSPYDFQGLKEDGLKILKEAADKNNLLVVSEVVDPRHIEMMTKYVNVLQIGSRNMHNFELLKEAGRSNCPVLLKRGMSATIEEFELAAEYLASEGNRNIIMCERGIRTFERATRNTLDLSCVAILKSETQLPVVVDLSHSLGRKDIIIPLAKASVAAGADGIMVEVHNLPAEALSDGFQQLNFDEFFQLMHALKGERFL
ncbi:MAG: bifunctional 3-deoxy-7-phosphoheptulonate synthase/chorismate mutase [Acutalibacteraceae bacterium]